MENSNNTTSTINVIEQDGNVVSLKIIKSDRPDCAHVLLPFFMFITTKTDSVQAVNCQEELAWRIVMKSQRIAAVLLTNQGDVFDYFAALKWIFCNGEVVGLDITRVAIVGYQQGANIAILLSLMAYHDGLPKISCQVLIESQFFVTKPCEFFGHRKSGLAHKDDQEWLNEEHMHNLPLELVDEELLGMPPTALLFSDKSGISYAVEHYCIKLLRVGKSVSYLVGDKASAINHEKDLLKNTVTQLAHFLLLDEN